MHLIDYVRFRMRCRENLMPRELEDAMVNELSDIRRKLDEAIQRIVNARVKGTHDKEAMHELAMLQNREVALTKPVFADAA